MPYDTLLLKVERAVKLHPKLFDKQLSKGLHRLIANAEDDFIETRSSFHLKRFLLVQFFLQKRIEKALVNAVPGEREVFVHIFSNPSCIGVAVMLSYQRQTEIFNEHHLLKAIQRFLPGVKAISESFLSWESIKDSYIFCYLELQKPRGKDLGPKERKKLQKDLQYYVLHGVASYCPSLFWPYNYEESYRQIFLLQKEFQHAEDLPQVSIHFTGQTPLELEFLIYMVCSKSKVSFDTNMALLPPSVRFVSHKYSSFKPSSPFDTFAFSLHIPTYYFDTHQSINLLNARNYVAALLEKTIGAFRDFNGGLFTIQENEFDNIKRALSNKIPNFSLFAETLFYSLIPLEAQVTLNMKQAESLFGAFSSVLREKKSFYFESNLKTGVLIAKAQSASFFSTFVQKIKKQENVIHAHVRIGKMYYFALIDPSLIHLTELEKQLSLSKSETNNKSLRLVFQEGLPLSLNPYYTASDVRCRTVYNLLFEGLTRLDSEENVVLAGAEDFFCSEDNMTYTFVLRQNRWSNGEKVTAFHYAEGWKQMLHLSDRTNTRSFLVIKNAEKILNGECSSDLFGAYAIDSKTLKVQLEYPDPYFLQRLSHPLFFPMFDHRKEPQIFNGPHFFSFQNKKKLILERNPHFWDSENVYFDKIEITFLSDPLTTLPLFEKGELDWIGPPFSIIPKEAIPSLEIRKNSTHLVYWLHINTQYRFFRSRWIRQALSLAIDRVEINKHILAGKPLFTILPPSLSLTSSSLNQNLQQAQILFARGLKEVGLTHDSFPIVHLHYFNHPRMVILAKYLQQTWEKAFGITVHIECTDWDIFRSALEKGEFQIGGCYETPFLPDALDLLERFENKNNLNFSQWKDPLFQEKISFARATTDVIEKKRWTQEAEEILATELPVIPISNGIQLYAHQPALKGYILNRTGHVDFRWAYNEGEK